MAAQGDPPLINPDAEELVFKLRLNSIPHREAITSLMLTIVAMGFMLNTVGISTFYFVSVHCKLYCILWLQDQLLCIPCILYCMVTSAVTRLVITYSMYSILYSYKCGYKTGYWSGLLFEIFVVVWLQLLLQVMLLAQMN